MANQMTRCPNCGERGTMERASCQKTKFSIGKAVVGSFVAGPLGMFVGGMMGTRRYSYRCSQCGFEKLPDELL